MLAGRTEWRDVPHAPGERIEFKTLSGLQMQRAKDKVVESATKNYMAMLKGLDAQTMATLREQEKQNASAEPGYDEETLIKWAVNGWSLDIECSDENKLLLDGPTLKWAVSVIVEMNTLPLAKSENSSLRENSHRDSEALTASSPAE